MRAVVTRIRNLRAENGLAQTEPLAIGLELPEGPLSKEMRRHVPLLTHLARLKGVEISSKVDIAGAFRDVVAGLGLVVDLPKKEIVSRRHGEAAPRDREAAERGGEDPRAARGRELPLARSGGRGRENEAAARRALRNVTRASPATSSGRRTHERRLRSPRRPVVLAHRECHLSAVDAVHERRRQDDRGEDARRERGRPAHDHRGGRADGGARPHGPELDPAAEEPSRSPSSFRGRRGRNASACRCGPGSRSRGVFPRRSPSTCGSSGRTTSS